MLSQKKIGSSALLRLLPIFLSQIGEATGGEGEHQSFFIASAMARPSA